MLHNKIAHSLLLGSLLQLLALPVLAAPVAEEFAARLCTAWNASPLPNSLATKAAGGSGWIDVVTDVAEVPDGTQIIASGRYDCAKTPEYAIQIERKDGQAICTGSGAYTGKRTWQFLPETEDYARYAAKFGIGAFLSLWSNGMKGSKTTAWSNSEHFQVFFQIATREGGDYLKPGCAR